MLHHPDENEITLKILLKIDGIFYYFHPKKITQEEIYSCKYIKTLHMCLDGTEWDFYDESFPERKYGFTDFRGEFNDH